MAIASSGWSCSARGRTAHADSDYDIAVFFEGLRDRWRELPRLAHFKTNILVETSAFLEARPLPVRAHTASAHR
jgi:hypothetical protein